MPEEPAPITQEAAEPEPAQLYDCDVCGATELGEVSNECGQSRCEECSSNLTCQSCEEPQRYEDDLHYVDFEGRLCDNCSFYCDSHEERVSGRDYIETIDDEMICTECSDNDYATCSSCDGLQYAENGIFVAHRETREDLVEQRYLCSRCTDGQEYDFNSIIGMHTPRSSASRRIVVGVKPYYSIRSLIESLPERERRSLNNDIFSEQVVNLFYMDGENAELTTRCSTGHTTLLSAYNNGRGGRCKHCIEALEVINSILGSADEPSYAKIQPYHYHSYDQDQFLHTAKDKRENNRMYFGLELETAFSTRHISNETGEVRASRVLKELKGTFVGERDGTVPNGAELISKPMTYEYLTSKTMINRLNKALSLMKTLGAVNGTQDNIGLHVHVSKAAFRSEVKATVEMEDDMNWFVNCFKGYVETVSRRQETSYCKFPITRIEKPMNASRMYIDKRVLHKGSHGYALNLNQSRTPTYEFRVFNSSQDIQHIIASVELVRNLSMFVINEPTIIGKTFKDIVMYKPTLYLKDYVAELTKTYPERMKGWDKVKLKEELEVK